MCASNVFDSSAPHPFRTKPKTVTGIKVSDIHASNTIRKENKT